MARGPTAGVEARRRERGRCRGNRRARALGDQQAVGVTLNRPARASRRAGILARSRPGQFGQHGRPAVGPGRPARTWSARLRPPPRGGPVGQESEVRTRSSRTGCLRASTPYSYASSRHQVSPASYHRRRPGDSHPAGWAAATVSSYDQILGWDADLRLLTPRAISVSAHSVPNRDPLLSPHSRGLGAPDTLTVVSRTPTDFRRLHPEGSAPVSRMNRARPGALSIRA